MHRNLKKGIGCMLIAILLFSGVCLISGKADSSYACIHAEERSAQTMREFGNTLKMQPFTTENIGVYDTASMQQIMEMGALSGKSSSDLLGMLCTVLLFLQFFLHYLITVGAACEIHKQSSLTVLRYIHNADGKK